MKILHISKYYFPYTGGVENTCKYLAEGMSKHKIAVLCFNDKCKDVIDNVNGVKVYRVATWINIARQALSLSYFSMLWKAIKEFDPEIIHFHWANPFPAAVLLCMLKNNVKLVVHWHMDIIKQAKIYPFIRPIERKLLQRANMILVTSPQYRDGSRPLRNFIDKVRIVPSAIDERNFILRPGDIVEINRIKEKYSNKKIIFFIGRHIQYKGLPYLIEAEKYIKNDCVILIAGNGPLTNELKGACTSSRISFIGRLNDDELRWYHHAAYIFAFPSITKNEAFGLALVEAMYCNTPAVTFTINGSGVNWVSINNKTGIEVPNGDVIAYANAIDMLLENGKLRDTYAENAKERVLNNFTIPKEINALEYCYNELAKL